MIREKLAADIASQVAIKSGLNPNVIAKNIPNSRPALGGLGLISGAAMLAKVLGKGGAFRGDMGIATPQESSLQALDRDTQTAESSSYIKDLLPNHTQDEEDAYVRSMTVETGRLANDAFAIADNYLDNTQKEESRARDLKIRQQIDDALKIMR